MLGFGLVHKVVTRSIMKYVNELKGLRRGMQYRIINEDANGNSSVGRTQENMRLH